MDGGSVMAPRYAIYGLKGQWEVENHGIPPDIEVQQDPKLVREGHDPQLEAAVNAALRLLSEHPVPTYQPPAYPNHNPQLPPKNSVIESERTWVTWAISEFSKSWRANFPLKF